MLWLVGGLIVLALVLLLVQIRIVRARTPRLPEADGPRMAVCGKDPVLKLLITGESPAAGVGVRHQADALAGQLGHSLLTHHQLSNHWCVAARSGLMAGELVDLINESPPKFHVVVIVLGVNDTKNLRSRAAFRTDLRNLDRVLRVRHPKAMLLWCGIPDLSRFPALPPPLAWLLGWRSRQLDRELVDIASAGQRSRHLPLPIRDDNDFATDGFHPGTRGYRDWGAGLAQVIAEGQ